MTKVGLVYDPLYLWHDTGAHPESALRLTAIMHVLTEAGLTVASSPCPPATLRSKRSPRSTRAPYIDYVREMAEHGGAWADPDTYISPRSYDAALRASGGALVATDSRPRRRVESAFCLVRPPATTRCPTTRWASACSTTSPSPPDTPFGERGMERVAIVDFDIHHGNGTQAAFYEDPRCSTSRRTSTRTTRAPAIGGDGDGAGRGLNVNVPLPAGCGDDEYRRVFSEALEPLLDRYGPQLILVSAGYDGHFDDPWPA